MGGPKGMCTASSQPGGLFSAPPEAQQRQRMDGQLDRFKGRGNSSSIVGGPLAFMPVDVPSPARPKGGGAHGVGYGAPSDGGGYHGGGYGGGYVKASPAVWEGAAGGRSSNNSQMVNGHFRSGTIGSNGYMSSVLNSSPSGRRDAQPDFLSHLEAAEQRDAYDAPHLAPNMPKPAPKSCLKNSPPRQMAPQFTYDDDEPPLDEEEEAVLAAAAQIAAEQGLGPAQQRHLEETLLARHREQSGFFQEPVWQPTWQPASQPAWQPVEVPAPVPVEQRAAGGKSTNSFSQHMMDREVRGGRHNANTSSIPGGIFG